MRFKITDIDNESFVQIPKSLLTQKNYQGLNSNAKIVYALLKDRMVLSRRNGWKDDNGDIFLLFKQKDMAELLGISVSSISRAMKLLQKYLLIEFVQQGLNRPNKIYINKIELVHEEDIVNIDAAFYQKQQDEGDFPASPDSQQCKSGFAEVQVRTCRSANQDLQQCKLRLAAVQANKTNINQTENNKTEKNKTENNNRAFQISPVDNTREESVQKPLSDVVVELSRFGGTEKLAEKFIRQFGIDAVMKQLGNLYKQKKKIENPMGWLRTALEEDFDLKYPQIIASQCAPSERTVPKKRSFILPLSPETQAYAETCAATVETATHLESPFYEFYLRANHVKGEC